MLAPSAPAPHPIHRLLPNKTQFKIQKVQAKIPPAKYLIRRRHSLAPEAVILEGNELDGNGTAAAGFEGGGVHPRRSCRIHSSSTIPCTVQQQKADAAMAIDSKIEQAMDLVKTHLIYAVRDEIELLRSRITELEMTVIQLEVENAVLREHIPRELLAGIPGLECSQQRPAKQPLVASLH